MMIDGPDALSAAVRAVSFAFLLNAAGIPIFIAAFGRLVPNSLESITTLGWRLTIAALVFVVAHQLLEGARMTGEMSGVFDPAMQKMALMSPAGAAFAFRVAALLLIAIGLRRSGALTLLGALLIISSFTLEGHTSTNNHRAAAAALLILHLSVVAFWLGSLWPLYITAAREQPAISARVIDKFSFTAAWIVPMILFAGVGLMALLLPSLATLRQPYGLLLLAKVAGFAVLMALAALNKWRYGPACAEGDTVAFKRTVIVEYALICAVLAITAAMTMFYSPEQA